MKCSRILTGVLSVAIVAILVSDTFGQDQNRRGDRGDRGDRGGRGGFGQRGGGPPGGFGGGMFRGRGGADPSMFLLTMDEVKTELQISPDQDEAIAKINQQGQERGGDRPDFGRIREMSDQERQEFMANFQKQQQERAKKMKEMLEEVLAPPQLERLGQLALQYRGIQALMEDDELGATLKITEGQKTKMQGAQESMVAQIREIFTGDNREDRGERVEKLREGFEKEVLGALNSDQQTKYEKMKGEPFTFPERRGPGGFRGRGGPGGPGGPGGFGGRGRGGDGGGPGRGDGQRRQRPPADE